MNKKVKTKYTTEFKERAVNMVISSEKAIPQIAKGLGLKVTTLYTWVTKTKSSAKRKAEKNFKV